MALDRKTVRPAATIDRRRPTPIRRPAAAVAGQSPARSLQQRFGSQGAQSLISRSISTNERATGVAVAAKSNPVRNEPKVPSIAAPPPRRSPVQGVIAPAVAPLRADRSPSLKISDPADAHEREAESVADTIMRMPEPKLPVGAPVSAVTRSPVVQRRCTSCEEEQGKRVNLSLVADERLVVHRSVLSRNTTDAQLFTSKPDRETRVMSKPEAHPHPREASPDIASNAASSSNTLVHRSCTECEEEKQTAKIERKEGPEFGDVHRAAGNALVQSELGSTPVYRKLTVSRPGDAHELEAERVADAVMRLPDRARETAKIPLVSRAESCPSLHRACAACESEYAHEESVGNDEAHVSRADSQTGDDPAVTTAVEANVHALQNEGQPLSRASLDFFEPRFGRDFSQVRVNTSARAENTARSLGASAFTVGKSISFGAGQYAPDSHAGRHLLAHELTHVAQQNTSELAVAPVRVGSRADRPPDESEQPVRRSETVSQPAVFRNSDLTISKTTSAPMIQGDWYNIPIPGTDYVFDPTLEGVETAAGLAGEAVAEGADWVATKGGQLAQGLADALGVSVNVTANGLEIDVPGFCPLDALSKSFKLPSLDGELMAPVMAIPIGTVVITGSLGVVGHIQPTVAMQLGPVCVDGLHVVINPLTGSFVVSGSISATTAASLTAEARAGVRGEVGVTGIVIIGGIPVPIEIPVAGLEAGIAGMARGIGAGTLRIGGTLGAGLGGISIAPQGSLDLGLAADLFLGAYGQVDLLGQKICRIYWQPYEWHGDIAGSVGIAFGLNISTGGGLSIVPTVSPPTFTNIPFSQIPLALSRDGFSDDCPIIDAICFVLRNLGLLPSQNGGVWDWGGPYGPGPRLAGPLDVYQRNPGIASGSKCRGACGPDCDTCEAKPVYTYVDPLTGDTWEYLNYQDCNWNEGCLEHDAAFDWAADVHGEIGKGAIIMPWHMAANIECACNNLAGNCIAWIAGLPPYDGKIYFADTATLVGRGGGGRLGSGSCRTDFPNAPECIASFLDRDSVLEAWGDRNRIGRFRDCFVATDLTTSSTMACHGGPGNYWNCTATDSVTGEDITVGLFECICCNDDDTSSSSWTEPHVVMNMAMSEELILGLCERNLIPRFICIPIEQRMIDRFGRHGRDLGLDPDTDPKSRLRPDDAPLIEKFKLMYNRLESWIIYIDTNHPELNDEFRSKFDIKTKRADWLKKIKDAGEDFKKRFRDISRTDTEAIRRAYNELLEGIRLEIDALNREIAAWYKTKTGTPGTIEEIIEEVHRQGTELWRIAWRAAILQVNRVLAILWPPARQQLLTWLAGKRAEHPDKDLSGPVGELDYLGSLSAGFKGPPKQNIRFDPNSFDVDGFIEAPPLTKYCVFILGIKPKHGNIFAKGTDIVPLKTFAADAQRDLVAKVKGYKDDPTDPFDVAIKGDDLPEQARGKAATERLYKLRERLSETDYRDMVEELKRAGLLASDGLSIREELSEDELARANSIMDKFDPQAGP